MALTEADARDVARDLLDVRRRECVRLDEIRRYVRGEVCRVFRPRRHSRDYRELVEMSKTNIMPLVVSTFAENLFIEGFRPAKTAKNSAAWDRDWQANRMDARQSGLWRSALEYGLAYATVIPSAIDDKPLGIITPYSPRSLTAVYADPINDEWPVYFITTSHGYDAGRRKRVQRVDLVDDSLIYHFIRDGQSEGTLLLDRSEDYPDGVQEHGLDIGSEMAPCVRFCSVGGDLDDQSRGEVEPLMPQQDALNQTTFTLRTVERAQGWRQRYASGIVPQVDKAGNEIEPFSGGADMVWTSTSADTKFGDFAEGDPTGLLNSRQSTLRITTATAQMAPHTLLVSDGISNLSAEALAALEAAQQRKIGELKTLFGEAAEQLLRLTSLAAGDQDGWRDRSAQVVWRDTESRSLAQVADALGKMAQMLAVPPEALWEKIPGVTEQDLKRWKKLADEEDQKAPEMPPGAPQPPDPEQLIQQGALGVNGRRPVSAGAPA